MTKKTTDKPVIGVDLGGTKILAGVVDSNGALLSQAKRTTKPSAGVDAVIDRMAKTVREAVEAAGLKLPDMAGLGTGAPGPRVLTEELCSTPRTCPGSTSRWPKC